MALVIDAMKGTIVLNVYFIRGGMRMHLATSAARQNSSDIKVSG